MLQQPGVAYLSPLVLVILAITGVIVSISDLKYGKIRNVVTLPMIVAGVTLNALPLSWHVGAGWQTGVYGLAVGFGLLLAPFWLGMIKAGDVKYLAGIGALAGPWVVVFTFLYGSLAHGVFSLIVLGRRHETKAALRNVGYWITRSVMLQQGADLSVHTQGSVPYALSLAVGLLAAAIFAVWRHNVFPLWA